MNIDNLFSLDYFISHRGASAIAPENTFAAIRLAKSYGSTWVELDVRFSGDKELIVFHDSNLFRTTGMNSPVLNENYKDLKNYDVGEWFHKSFKGEKIPTLIEVINYCNNNSINLNIEIKTEKGLEFSIGSKVQETVSKLWSSKNNLLISSFDFKPLSKIVETQKVKKMILLEEFSKKKFVKYNLNSFHYFGLDFKKVDKKVITYLLDLRKKVLVYTVNDPLEAKLLKSWGVTSIFTDLPKNLILLDDG